jgi:hypothetical protein
MECNSGCVSCHIHSGCIFNEIILLDTLQQSSCERTQLASCLSCAACR